MRRFFDSCASGVDDPRFVARRAAVRQADIGRRAHLDEARNRPLAFEGITSIDVGEQLGRLDLRRGEQLNPRLVKRVDQPDEALHFVALLGRELRDAIDDHAVEALGDGEIVLRAEGLVAEIGEGKAGDVAPRLRHGELAAVDLEHARLAGWPAGQHLKGLRQGGFGFGVVRHMEGLGAGELFHPVVGARLELHDVHVRVDQLDRLQEERAVEPILVEIVGIDVRGRNNHHAT